MPRIGINSVLHGLSHLRNQVVLMKCECQFVCLLSYSNLFSHSHLNQNTMPTLLGDPPRSCSGSGRQTLLRTEDSTEKVHKSKGSLGMAPLACLRAWYWSSKAPPGCRWAGVTQGLYRCGWAWLLSLARRGTSAGPSAGEASVQLNCCWASLHTLVHAERSLEKAM